MTSAPNPPPVAVIPVCDVTALIALRRTVESLITASLLTVITARPRSPMSSKRRRVRRAVVAGRSVVLVDVEVEQRPRRRRPAVMLASDVLPTPCDVSTTLCVVALTDATTPVVSVRVLIKSAKAVMPASVVEVVVDDHVVAGQTAERESGGRDVGRALVAGDRERSWSSCSRQPFVPAVTTEPVMAALNSATSVFVPVTALPFETAVVEQRRDRRRSPYRRSTVTEVIAVLPTAFAVSSMSVPFEHRP